MDKQLHVDRHLREAQLDLIFLPLTMMLIEQSEACEKLAIALRTTSHVRVMFR
jgi:hypothetical protein